MNECNYKQMQQYLIRVQALQRRAAGKVDIWVITPRSSGSIFGGIVGEIEITINVHIMNVFNDPNQGKSDFYQRDFDFYSFYDQKKNDAIFAELKSEIDRIVKDYDKEYLRRMKNMMKRHQGLL